MKGRELAAHDPRGDKPRFYSYCIGTNGADHAEGTSSSDLCRVAMNDSLCLCTFCASGVWGADTDKIVTDMLNPLCGWNWKTDDYWMAAKRIVTAERVFNVREGISAKDDRLPKRMYAEKLPAGPKKGVVFTEEDHKKVAKPTPTSSSAGTKRASRRRPPSRPTAWTSSSMTSTRQRRSTTSN